MDTQDGLDRLLERSAPAAPRVGVELTQAMQQMTHTARAQVAAEKPGVRRMPRLVTGIGVTILLTGGGGAAMAAGGFDWLPWAQDPDAAYVFTLPSGRECEIRGVVEQTEHAGDWNTFPANVEQLAVEKAAVDRWAAQIRADPQAIVQVVNKNGQWEDPSPLMEPTEDDIYAAAHRVAMSEAIVQQAESTGVVWGFDGDEQFQCEAVAP